VLVQVCLFFLEVRANNKMRNEAIGTNGSNDRYDPLSEEKRRVRNFKKTACLSSVALVLFIIVISIGNDKIEGRSCTFGKVLEGGVCVSCEDSSCLSCNQGKD